MQDVSPFYRVPEGAVVGGRKGGLWLVDRQMQKKLLVPMDQNDNPETICDITFDKVTNYRKDGGGRGIIELQQKLTIFNHS